jgi:hypothetical protein
MRGRIVITTLTPGGSNMNIARWKTAWVLVIVSIFTMIFGITSQAHAEMKEAIVSKKYMLYINKFTNLVNIKDIINIDYVKYNKTDKYRTESVYIISDINTRTKFIMPSYSKKINLRSRVDQRVFISRLANAIKSHETGGVGAYTRKSYSSNACGAYQYMPTTWNNFMGYSNACKAPDWVQDARIEAELRSSYKKYQDWRKVVAAHLLPSRANNMRTWNKPVSGNPTVNQYVSSIFKKANIALA